MRRRGRHGRAVLLLSLLTALSVAVALVAGGAQGASPGDTGAIGQALQITGNGRHLEPFGRLTSLGNFPTGGAVTRDGHFLWTVSTGRGQNDLRIVSLASGAVVQVIPLAGASGGITMDPAHSLAFVSGVAQSSDTGDAPPAGTPGTRGDVVLEYAYDSAGHASFVRAIPVPPPSGAPTPQNFPPTNAGQRLAWPDRLAVSPDGATLLVPLNLADAAAIVDVASGAVRYVNTGAYPYGAAILPDGHTGLVSNETPGTVSVIDLRSATKVSDITVGPHLSHPEGIAVDPSGQRAYVALANADEVAVIDTATRTLAQMLSVERPEGLGSSPTALTVTPDGRELLVAESGADELAAFRLHAEGADPALSLIGRIPTAAYPTAVAVSAPAGCVTRRAASGEAASRARGRSRARRRGRHRHRLHHRRTHRPRPAAAGACQRLAYVSGKGLGTGPNPKGPQPSSPLDTDNAINATQYLPLLNLGAAGVGPLPSEAQIAADSAAADAQVRPGDPQAPPAGTPLRPDGPIKHVFYIVKENRTYDQILGDDPRGDGDPSLALFGGHTTPNDHALVTRFGLLDHVYANSEASIDGHFWTSAGSVSDYVNKNWFQNYASRGRPYDFGVYAVTWPSTGFLFDQALRQNLSFYNYGEAIAGVVPLPDKDRTSAETQLVTQKLAQSDIGQNGCYPNDASIGKDAITGQTVFDSSPPAGAPPGSESRYDCFNSHFTAQLATGSVPALNYLVLSNDHTRVLDPSSYTPQAMIADNDHALGQIVDRISHSSIWASSAIFVVEDDSQDGADHVDAHRIPAYVISPYARPGAVIHRRYDFLSVIHSIELITGLKPLGLLDTLGVPMYDAFQSTPNLAPYTAIPPQVDLLAKNPAAAGTAQARALRFRGIDQISQRLEDRMLWRSVFGASVPPPPPGPNAVIEPRAGRAAGYDG